YVNGGRNEMDDLFYANVEALANDEGGGNNYAAKIWWRYDRPDGGFNCTRGGNRDCL
ncbi:MAG: NVEALA domain-containing protein, partial [Bacteroidales bacterium]|nr:NVEALA domain-containing protein [Bacteroidales bacterium]